MCYIGVKSSSSCHHADHLAELPLSSRGMSYQLIWRWVTVFIESRRRWLQTDCDLESLDPCGDLQLLVVSSICSGWVAADMVSAVKVVLVLVRSEILVTAGLVDCGPAEVADSKVCRFRLNGRHSHIKTLSFFVC